MPMMWTKGARRKNNSYRTGIQYDNSINAMQCNASLKSRQRFSQLLKAPKFKWCVMSSEHIYVLDMLIVRSSLATWKGRKEGRKEGTYRGRKEGRRVGTAFLISRKLNRGPLDSTHSSTSPPHFEFCSSPPWFVSTPYTLLSLALLQSTSASSIAWDLTSR